MVVVTVKCSKCGKTTKEVLCEIDGPRGDLYRSKCCDKPTVLKYATVPNVEEGIISVALEEKA